LVLPPRVARIQAVIIPIVKSNENNDKIIDAAFELKKELIKAGVRTHVDDRNNYNPGWKYNHYELKGVPIRLELGNKEKINKYNKNSKIKKIK
jgi:prolyl-tRNA synthetase